MPQRNVWSVRKSSLTDGHVRLYPLQIRYVWPSELDLMAQLAGLRLRERWSNWKREPFDSESTKHISIYDAETATKLDYAVHDGVALITLNDPPANTYSYEMMQQLDRAILDARMDEAVQVIVITGKGEKFFCAGADIQMLANVTPTFKYYFCLHANETLNRVWNKHRNS